MYRELKTLSILAYKTARWGRRSGAAAACCGLALLLAACTAEPVAETGGFDKSRAVRIFSVGYQDIADIYIQEVEIADLATAGLGGLTAVDPELRFGQTGEQLTMTYVGRPVISFAMPETADARAWGKITAAALERGRAVSPLLSEYDSEALYETVFDGIVTELDGFSRYAGRDEARENRASRDGFGGIGVRIRVIDEGVRILSVMEDTPAEEAGLRAQDLITSIDGEAAAGLSQREVVRRLRGPIRSKVNLLIARDEQDPKLVITVTRAHVVPQTVTYHAEGRIGYIRVSNFNQSTARSLRQKIRQAHDELGESLAGYILDLRGNPGGLLDQAVEAADLFVAEGRIVSTRGRHPDSHQIFDAESDDIAEGHAVVLLVDGSSASASEIVAAALQDDGRAVLVGSNSFGKGTVQTVLRLPNEGELTLTWANFHAPSGYALNRVGVLPNLCTSGEIASSADVLERLRQGEFPLRPSALVKAPEGERQAAQLAESRARCPKRDGAPEIDLDVARRLLADPALYKRALGKPPETAGIDQQAALGGAAHTCPHHPPARSIQPDSC